MTGAPVWEKMSIERRPDAAWSVTAALAPWGLLVAFLVSSASA